MITRLMKRLGYVPAEKYALLKQVVDEAVHSQRESQSAVQQSQTAVGETAEVVANLRHSLDLYMGAMNDSIIVFKETGEHAARIQTILEQNRILTREHRQEIYGLLSKIKRQNSAADYLQLLQQEHAVARAIDEGFRPPFNQVDVMPLDSNYRPSARLLDYWTAEARPKPLTDSTPGAAISVEYLD